MAPSNSLVSTSTASILWLRRLFSVWAEILRVAGAISSPLTVMAWAGRVPCRLLS